MLPKHVFLCIPGEDASDEACRDAALHVDCNLAEAEDDNRKHRIPGKEIELTMKTCHKDQTSALGRMQQGHDTSYLHDVTKVICLDDVYAFL